MNNVEAALYYREELGWAPIACKAGEKTPAQKFAEYVDVPPSEADIKRMFADSRRNVAVLMGSSSGIVSLDIDSLEARKWADKNLPETPLRFTTGRAGGEQRLYRNPRVAVKNAVGVHGEKLDIRSTGGYSMVPPSKTIREYLWRQWPTKELLEQTPVFPVEVLPEERKLPERGIAVDGTESRLRVIRRAMLYVNTIEPAVSGQRGHNKMFATICKLLHEPPQGFGLSVAESMPILASYSMRCQPPFSDKDLNHKIESALSRLQKS